MQYLQVFEKDIMSLSNTMITEIQNEESYTGTHVCQDIQSLQKLIGVCFQALKKGQFNKPNGDQNQNEVGTSLQALQKYQEWAGISNTELSKYKSPNK